MTPLVSRLAQLAHDYSEAFDTRSRELAWLAREAAPVMSFFFEPRTCRAVVPLLDEIPPRHDNAPGGGARRKAEVDASVEAPSANIGDLGLGARTRSVTLKGYSTRL